MLAVPVDNAEIPATLAAQLVDTNGDQLIDFYDLNSLNAAGNVVVDGSGAKFNSHLVAVGVDELCCESRRNLRVVDWNG